MTWTVQVIEDATGEIVKTIPVRGEREAIRVESAIDSKLNHEKLTCRSVGQASQSA